jgi:DNA-binding NtrC family response regulator
MAGKKVLFIAKPETLTPLFREFKEHDVEAGLAENLSGAVTYVEKQKPSVVFTRARLPGYRADDLLARAGGEDSYPPIIVFTDQGSAEEAGKYLGLGAYDYWLEPLEWEKIRAVLPDEGDEPEPEPQEPAEAPAKKKTAGVSIIGEHPTVKRVLALARQVAPSKATVLISGESGTGKELFARYVHQASDRAEGPFIAINCAALPEHLLESELFGHEKGSFTGAIARKLGKFELAHGGTILLDEISEMELGLQAKLLRVLQEGELDRVGGADSVKVDVRVLATTNRNIEESVRNKEFRQDLYFRLNVIPLKLPALRDRGDDVHVLARFFANRFCEDYGLPRLTFSDEAGDWLSEYDWPGNVRELQNLMERAVLLAGAGPIEKKHFLLDAESWPLPEEIDDEEAVEQSEQAVRATLESTLEEQTLAEIEREAILRRLKKESGNRTRAAELLGISVRTLRNKLNEYKKLGLDIP